MTNAVGDTLLVELYDDIMDMKRYILEDTVMSVSNTITYVLTWRNFLLSAAILAGFVVMVYARSLQISRRAHADMQRFILHAGLKKILLRSRCSLAVRCCFSSSWSSSCVEIDIRQKGYLPWDAIQRP